MVFQSFLRIALAAVCCAGCASSRHDKSATQAYETIEPTAARDREASQREHVAALALLDQGKWPDAEAAVKRALTADVMNGQAHNTLGHIYFHAGNFYLAAWEFQYASKLMPNQPEPRNNLGLVFEATGKLDEAISAYQHAIDMEPDNPQFIGNEARARVRRGDARETIRPLLNKLIAVDPRPAWVDWSADLLRAYDQKPAR